MPTDRGRRPLHHSTTDEENMMTPEQVKQLITDSLKHELNDSGKTISVKESNVALST